MTSQKNLKQKISIEEIVSVPKLNLTPQQSILGTARDNKDARCIIEIESDVTNKRGIKYIINWG